ncbi:zinc finger FYVE domain-containing protein 26 homolog [Diorhabda carinulata]|uniref:zinc finger FYVE domain-containing protein 26 homolog n=1 Tax=Diorhabda carinulata TaxID=1163345 RepID=UPI0025A1D3D3|nr:zinc finger FYVE domain-containing protein 26 homolog [Diorhabda carinulata]
MEEILKTLEKVSKRDSEHGRQVNLLYKRISEFELTNKYQHGYLTEYILPKIYDLCERDIIKEDILYLSIIGNQNFVLLNKFLRYIDNTIGINIKNPTKLFDYCLCKKNHWFSQILSTDRIYIPNRTISNKILILQLINLTNFNEFDVDHIKNLLKNLNKEDIETYWNRYFRKIEYAVKIIEYIKTNEPLVVTREVFNFFQKHSALETFSNYLDLKQSCLEEIYDFIKEEEEIFETFNVQCIQFEAFSILKKLLDCITKTPNLNISETVREIKEKLLNITNFTLQLELLEDVFASLFIETYHLHSEINESILICEEKEVRLIIYLVKDVLEEIKTKNIPSKDSPEHQRLSQLHKVISDAIWRMELIRNVKDNEKCDKYLMKYMLSTPESLIQMCVKKYDFEGAFQVIKIFSIEDPQLICELHFAESLINLRDNLKKTFKIKAIKKVDPKISVTNFDLAIDKIVEQFFERNEVTANRQMKQRLDILLEKYYFFKHYTSENEKFMNMLDLAITLPDNFENSDIMLQLAAENYSLEDNVTSNYVKFYNKLNTMFREIARGKNLSIGQLLISPHYPLDLNKHIKQEEFYKSLSQAINDVISDLSICEPGELNNRHPSHISILKLNNLLSENSESGTDPIKYISKLYNYLKAFSRILYIEQNTSDIISKGKNTSYFNLIPFNRSLLMGKLLFERHLEPGEFEKYFGKLKLDYLYHVVGNCFPTINLHAQENVAKEELYPENNLYIPNKGVIAYIQRRNWLLAYILTKMYTVQDVNVDISEDRIRVFMNYLSLNKIRHLKLVYNNNVIVTALQNEISSQKISDIIKKRCVKFEKLARAFVSRPSNDSQENGQELEEDTVYIDWKQLFDLVQCIPEEHVKRNRVWLDIIDTILSNLITDDTVPEYYRYVLLINNRELRLTNIKDNMRNWPGDFCLDIIKSELTRFNVIEDGQVVELKMWSLHIDLCEKLKSILGVKSWYTAYEWCVENKRQVISLLVENDNIDLMLDYIDLHSPSQDLLEAIDEYYFYLLFQSTTHFEKIKLLLDILPFQQGINICYTLIKLLKKLDHLKFIVEYLLNNVNDDVIKYVEISLKMLGVFQLDEQLQLLDLLEDPLSIIELLLMNTKLDKLSAVLNVLKEEVLERGFNDRIISLEKIDVLLRRYAEKSLDFRIIAQPNIRLLKPPECNLMQSLDSLNLSSDVTYFIMPQKVPTKAEWVPNSEVLECMCCVKTVFSMFNRRHHCRRCGRVVCYYCSLKRMLVPTYGDLLVRVCNGCYFQTTGVEVKSGTNDTTSTKSFVNDYWILTDNPEHNKIAREEFSYEHAPSVSLCLSIMKYHSKNVDYPKFLLDHCNMMLKLVLPNQEPTQEIDYMLIIKMLKTLALAAKMSSIECSLHNGTALADRIISQADLLGLLAERGCFNLLPVPCKYSQGNFIDASVLRRVRDKLLENEQWNLALEVSTKAGLDNAGVFAAWGKSCLKAGSLVVAREKFQRCLDKTAHYEYSLQNDNSETQFGFRKFTKTSNNINFSESKKSKDPPLLTEIIQILESNTRDIDQKEFTINENITNHQQDLAVCISNKMRNLKNISSQLYYQPVQIEKKSHSSRPPLCRLFYDECVYYLTRYGTRLSLLEFYIKHGDIYLALTNIIDNRLGTDTFVEIYMHCLKEGVIGILQEKMSLINSSLDVWKDYLMHICRHLEQFNMLHSLYQLQQFMGDSVRAAMTCMRFYQENASTFKDLLKNSQFLNMAEQHLRYGAEQEEWIDVATVTKLTPASQTSFEEKSIANPSLVMKMSTKDICKHIKTMGRQIEVTEFLAKCEDQEGKPMQVYMEMEKQTSEASACKDNEEKPKIPPTLFGSTQDIINLAVLVIVCGQEIKEGFALASKLIQDFSLKPAKIYCEACKQLAKEQKYSSIAELVNCIKESNDISIVDTCDEMLHLAVVTSVKANVPGAKVENLIKLIFHKATKIAAYIDVGHLKTAYFLAVKYKRMSDVRRISREAELLNQPAIKALCQKVLQNYAQSPSRSPKES